MSAEQIDSSTSKTADEIMRIVQNALTRNGWSIDYLARKCEVPASTLRAWLSGTMIKGLGSIATYKVIQAIGFEVWPGHLVKRGPVLVEEKVKHFRKKRTDREIRSMERRIKSIGVE